MERLAQPGTTRERLTVVAPVAELLSAQDFELVFLPAA
jgi:hypothetical protein